MTNQSCQTDFIEYTEFTPIVTAIQINDAKTVEEEDEDDYEICECCCLCAWYLAMGGFALGMMYYTGAL